MVKRKPTILFIGDVGHGQTSGMRRNALSRMGYRVSTTDSGKIWEGASYLDRQIEHWREHGTRVDRFNESVAHAVETIKPNLIWAEKQELLDPTLLTEAKAKGIITLHYNPDPYFSLSWKRTKRADACLQVYDVMVVTKQYEMERYQQASCGELFYTPLGFDPLCHRPAKPRLAKYDISFVGGWEPRRELLLARARSDRSSVAIWGYGWRIAQQRQISARRALRLGRLTPGQHLYWGAPQKDLSGAIMRGENASGEVYGADYSAAVANSRITLGLLREVCPDQHTTRTFEIPAMQGFMLADRSEEHLEYFEEGKEAVFFGSDDEFIDKKRYFLKHDIERTRIAAAGRRRCLTSGYSYDERLWGVLQAVLPLHPPMPTTRQALT